MRQLAHKLGTGRLTIEEVPPPSCPPGMIVILNHYSLISAGTEATTVRAARSNSLSKARQKPGEIKQLVDLCRKQGPVQAYRAVMKRLDAYSPLGYSSAGEVIQIGSQATGFAVGDLAAAGGVGYANHGELVSVPVNLCVKLPPAAKLDLAAYNTLGAIALQGIRQADLRLGESCVVIGLGLIGQLTGLMLRAAGVRTAGVDVDSFAVSAAAGRACDSAWLRSDPALQNHIDEFTHGLGADGVIITAAASSADPINFAGRVARKRGRVVVVGAVPTGFDRDPYWYRKELELRMSCSYGPGRYDPAYEEEGVDYPAAYVRWTEKRNMLAFQDLVQTGRIDIGHLTTHVFDLDQAPDAYDLILKRTAPFLGILLRYQPRKPVQTAPLVVDSRPRQSGKAAVAFIGAGSYAQSQLLPNFPNGDREIVRQAVFDHSGATSKRVAEKYHFCECVSDCRDIFENSGINTVFIATRHDSHAEYILRALGSGKNVFVEKPLALNADALAKVTEAYDHLASAAGRSHPLLMVGYNRRFSPLAAALKEQLGAAPVSMLYRVNAGQVPAESWIHNPRVGGGRIIGEVCHFVDFLMFLCGSRPSRVHATALPDSHGHQDTVNIQFTFDNGSIGTVAYYANGSPDVEKEYIEVYSSGLTAILHDFRRLDVFRSGSHFHRRLWFQDKGQKHMLRSFLDAITDGKAAPIPFPELRITSVATFGIGQSIVTGRPVIVS